MLLYARRFRGVRDHNHTDAHVERPKHLAGLHGALFGQNLEQVGERPRRGVHRRVHRLREHAVEIPGQPAACAKVQVMIAVETSGAVPPGT